MVNEWRLIWTTPGGGGQSTLYTQGADGGEQATATAIKTWLGQITQGLSNQVSVNLDPEVRKLADASGQLTGVATVNPGNVTPGNVNSQPVSDASQILFRWNTGVIHRGRRMVGRTFIPGLPVGSLVNGNIGSSSAADFASKNADFVEAIQADPLVVWHRPVNGSGGLTFTVTGGSVWSEMAVLRRRRG